MTKTFAIYARQSDDQQGEGWAVARQVEDCLDLARTMRLSGEPIIYVDNDLSATNTRHHRPGYQRLLAALHAGEHDVLIIWHNDRLHRRPEELEEFIALVETIDLRIAVVRSNDLDLSTPSGRAVARILGAIARQEIEHKQDRRRRSERQRAERGEHAKIGKRGFGYGRTVTVDGIRHWIDRDQLNPVEAAAIRDAARRLMKGELPHPIFTQWNAAGLTTVNDKPWIAPTFRQMMCRPSLAGIVTYLNEPIKGATAQWPAILTVREHRAVVQILNSQIRHPSIRPAVTVMFSGIPECGRCGRPMVARNYPLRSRTAAGEIRIRDVDYYECPSRSAGYHARATAHRVDDQILTEAAAVLYNARHNERPERAVADEQSDITRHLARNRARRANLIDAVADATLTNQEVRYRLAQLEDEARELNRRLTQLPKANAPAADVYRRADAFIDGIRDMRVDTWPQWFADQHPDLGHGVLGSRILTALRELPTDVRAAVVRSTITVVVGRTRDPGGQVQVTPRRGSPADTKVDSFV